MVKYVDEAEFDYHSLNYSRDAHAVRTEVAIYRPLLLLLLLQLLLMLEELAVIERINVVIAGGRSLIIAITAIIPI